MALLLGGCITPLELPEVRPEAGLREDWMTPRTPDGESLTSIAGLADDARLVALVELALESNPDLVQTAYRLRESGALLGEVAARRWPAGELAVSQSRGRQADGGSSASSTTSLGLDISWEVDVWGRLADQVREADSRHRALEADYLAASNSLAARTLQTALRRISLSRQLEIEATRVASLEATLEIVRERFRIGLGAITDWDASQSELATTQATVEGLHESVRQTDRDLAVLLGDLNLEPQEDLSRLPDMAVLEISLPRVSLPAEVLAARPDVAAARQRLLASGAAVSAARKALLPSFTLSGNFTQAGPGLDEALKADPVWSLLGNLAAPLFNRKALLSEHEASRYRQHEAAWAYRAVLLA
ncbi:MAG: TolC family protein, partial [Acidobacteriota bacterium]